MFPMHSKTEEVSAEKFEELFQLSGQATFKVQTFMSEYGLNGHEEANWLVRATVTAMDTASRQVMLTINPSNKADSARIDESDRPLSEGYFKPTPAKS
jgi:hypothetical protein